MTAPLLLSTLRSGDEGALREVFVESWRHLTEVVLAMDTEGCSPEVWPLSPTVVAYRADQPIGFAQLNRGYLERLYVHPAYHGLGAGSLLLSAASALGASALEVDEGNGPARRFYERAGWAWSGGRAPNHNFPERFALTYRRLPS